MRVAWAVGVAVAGAVSWWGWLSWWALEDPSPRYDDWLLLGAVVTLAVAVVVGDLRVRQWLGLPLAVGTAAIVSFPSFVLADPLGVIAWVMVVVVAAGGGAVVTTATFLIRRAVDRSSVTEV